jgi:hypothetical protein
MRRKYSWRGKLRKLRLSVSMPMKRESRLVLARAVICRSIPSRWSLNHQAEPNCTLPGTEPS